MSTPPPTLMFQDVAALRAGVRVLDRVSFTIAPHERVAVVGANGSGKSMIARLAVGLDTPAQGRVRLFGADIARMPAATLRALRSQVALVLQGGSLLADLTLEDNLRLGMGATGANDPRSDTIIDRALVSFDLEHAYGHLAADLSEAERRRAELARAFVRAPDLLVLDEPLEGADSASAAALEARLNAMQRRRPCAMLLTTHDAALAERLAGTVYRLRLGVVERAG